MLKAERISCSDPKLSDAQTRNFEAIKHMRADVRPNGQRHGASPMSEAGYKAWQGQVLEVRPSTCGCVPVVAPVLEESDKVSFKVGGD